VYLRLRDGRLSEPQTSSRCSRSGRCRAGACAVKGQGGRRRASPASWMSFGERGESTAATFDCWLRETRAGSDLGNRWGWKHGPAREARAAGDDGEATAQQGPSDSATECVRLAAPLDSPDPSSGATGNGLSVRSCDAAPDPAHRLLLC